MTCRAQQASSLPSNFLASQFSLLVSSSPRPTTVSVPQAGVLGSQFSSLCPHSPEEVCPFSSIKTRPQAPELQASASNLTPLECRAGSSDLTHSHLPSAVAPTRLLPQRSLALAVAVSCCQLFKQKLSRSCLSFPAAHLCLIADPVSTVFMLYSQPDNYHRAHSSVAARSLLSYSRPLNSAPMSSCFYICSHSRVPGLQPGGLCSNCCVALCSEPFGGFPE